MADEELKVTNAVVLPYDQEIILINKILEVQNTTKIANELKVPLTTVNQVLWKYKDVIAVIIQNKDLAAKISDEYEKNLDIALKANNKAIKLLARQLDILYDEFTSEANNGVVMKDYLINQVCQIQEKLQKLIDQNDIRYKDNRTFLENRVKGFKEVQEVSEPETDYLSNTKTVFEKLKEFTRTNQKNIERWSKATEMSFDIYDRDTGAFIRRYRSIRAAVRDGYGCESTLGKRVREAFNTKNDVFYSKWIIKNAKRGEDADK